jgi:hypothetical protein
MTKGLMVKLDDLMMCCKWFPREVREDQWVDGQESTKLVRRFMHQYKFSTTGDQWSSQPI